MTQAQPSLQVRLRNPRWNDQNFGVRQEGLARERERERERDEHVNNSEFPEQDSHKIQK